jgi:cbb3-type cytochrome oxidase maturation protein
MTDFFYLIPVALALGAVGLAAFMWSLKSGQYEDLEGAAERILSNDGDKPIVKTRQLDSSLKKEPGCLSSTDRKSQRAYESSIT